MPYFALFYDDLVDDYVARRAAAREEHLRGVRAPLPAGALADPGDRAAVEAFARADPYVTTGLVRRWGSRPWTVVIGDAPAPAGAEGGQP